MKHLLSGTILAVSTAIASPGLAAQVQFDLSGLFGVVSFTQATGGFAFDTDSQSFSDVDFSTSFGSFGSGEVIANPAGFGLDQNAFLFTGTGSQLLFETGAIGDLDAGVSAELSAFATEAISFNADFQADDFPFDLFSGDVTVTGLAEQPDGPAPIPLPASLPLLLAAFGGLGMMRLRKG